MKRTIAILLLILCCIIAVSCKSQNPDRTRDYDATVPDNTGIENAFSIKQKKRSYKGNDIVILYLKNNTGNEYFITITGSFLNATGEEAASSVNKTKTLFENSEICFVFQPGVTFDNFKYEISSEKKESLSNGKFTFSSYVTVDIGPHPSDMYEGLEKIRTTVSFKLKVKNDFSEAKRLKGEIVLFDNTGEVFEIFQYDKASEPGELYKDCMFAFNDSFWEDGMQLPQKLEGELEIGFDYEYMDNEWDF